MALVRNPQRFKIPKGAKVEVLQGNLTKAESIKNLPEDIDAAYYLVHSMSDDPDRNLSPQGDFWEDLLVQSLSKPFHHFQGDGEKTHRTQRSHP